MKASPHQTLPISSGLRVHRDDDDAKENISQKINSSAHKAVPKKTSSKQKVQPTTHNSLRISLKGFKRIFDFDKV